MLISPTKKPVGVGRVSSLWRSCLNYPYYDLDTEYEPLTKPKNNHREHGVTRILQGLYDLGISRSLKVEGERVLSKLLAWRYVEKHASYHWIRN
jgi:hypothetical protein